MKTYLERRRKTQRLAMTICLVFLRDAMWPVGWMSRRVTFRYFVQRTNRVRATSNIRYVRLGVSNHFLTRFALFIFHSLSFPTSIRFLPWSLLSFYTHFTYIFFRASFFLFFFSFFIRFASRPAHRSGLILTFHMFRQYTSFPNGVPERQKGAQGKKK